MKIVFIRHGEPDKTGVDERGFIGQGRDMAPLSELGIQQAEEVSVNPLLKGCQIIVSSPYTRALQTAANFMKCLGEYPQGKIRKWETITEIIERTKPVFDKYVDLGYERIIVVAHGGVIRRYIGVGLIDHCEACEVEYSKDFKCFGWV